MTKALNASFQIRRNYQALGKLYLLTPSLLIKLLSLNYSQTELKTVRNYYHIGQGYGIDHYLITQPLY